MYLSLLFLKVICLMGNKILNNSNVKTSDFRESNNSRINNNKKQNNNTYASNNKSLSQNRNTYNEDDCINNLLDDNSNNSPAKLLQDVKEEKNITLRDVKLDYDLQSKYICNQTSKALKGKQILESDLINLIRIKGYQKLDNLCPLKFLPLNFKNLTFDITRKNCYFNEELIKTLEKSSYEINSFLKKPISDFINIGITEDDLIYFKSNNLEFISINSEAISESKKFKFNICNFQQKSYFLYEIEESKELNNNKNIKKLKIKNKTNSDNHLLIINTSHLFLNIGLIFAIKVYADGRLMAGRINLQSLLFEGLGIFISKSQNIVSGNILNIENNKNELGLNYINNNLFIQDILDYKEQILKGKIVNYNKKFVYEGTILNFKKETISDIFKTDIKNLDNNTENSYEISDKYIYTGSFSKGKKVKGSYTYKNEYNSYFNIKKIIIERDLASILDNNYKKYSLTFNISINNNRDIIYKGKINNNKFNDSNADLLLNSISEFPRYHGSIKDNKKEGNGKYYWDNDLNLRSYFKDNNINSKLATDLNNKDKNDRTFKNEEYIHKYSLINLYGNEYECIVDNNIFIEFKDSDDTRVNLEDSYEINSNNSI